MDLSTLTPQQRALLPDSDDVAFYRQHGYWISAQIVPDEVPDGAVRGMNRFYTGDYDADLPGTAGTSARNRRRASASTTTSRYGWMSWRRW
jgi:hypothetical protein